MDDVTWGALALTLTLLGGMWTWLAFRRRGVASGLRAAGFTLLPAAAWLTHTLELLTRVAGAVGDWATTLVFNPFTWVGIMLAGVSVLLLGVSGFLSSRQLGGQPARRQKELGAGKSTQRSAGRSGKPAAGTPAIDDDLAEIEALLRKRGIS